MKSTILVTIFHVGTNVCDINCPLLVDGISRPDSCKYYGELSEGRHPDCIKEAVVLEGGVRCWIEEVC